MPRRDDHVHEPQPVSPDDSSYTVTRPPQGRSRKYGRGDRSADMDSYEEDAAGGVLAPLVLYERARLLGAYHLRTPLPSTSLTLYNG
jgi:hypothetical protein